MGRATCIVNTEFRAKLYAIAARPDTMDLYILRDRPWGHELRPDGTYTEQKHYLEIISDKLKHGDNGHVDVILDERGLRFGPHEDV